MYYLAKFCRICIKTGVKLVDIETSDIDSIKYSEKLEKCTKMVISRESLSTEICIDCIKKLRISYDFQKMCKQSSIILQGYLTELISTSNKVTPENFISSELRITVTPLNNNVKGHKRKRITKVERCSILKKLLLTNNNNPELKQKVDSQSGGLKTIIEFTKNYDFNYKCKTTNKADVNPLNQLTAFTNNFFSNNFIEFTNTILYLINDFNTYESDSDEEMFLPYDEENPSKCNIKIKKENLTPLIEEIKCEEVIVEPDIKIKTELDDDYDDYNKPFLLPPPPPPPLQPPPFFNSFIYNNNNNNNQVELLDKLVEKLNENRIFPARCRTRGNPYINPHLKQQFQMRSFQCDKCNRSFKTPGYLKAHASKVHT